MRRKETTRWADQPPQCSERTAPDFPQRRQHARTSSGERSPAAQRRTSTSAARSGKGGLQGAGSAGSPSGTKRDGARLERASRFSLTRKCPRISPLQKSLFTPPHRGQRSVCASTRRHCSESDNSAHLSHCIVDSKPSTPMPRSASGSTSMSRLSFSMRSAPAVCAVFPVRVTSGLRPRPRARVRAPAHGSRRCRCLDSVHSPA